MVRGRWLVLAGVAGLVYAVMSFLPPLGHGSGGLAGVVGTESEAISAQIEAVQRFRMPLLTRVAVVQHDPDGLNPYAQARVVLRALAVNKESLQGTTTSGVRLALPVINRPELGAGGGAATTAVTYLFTDPAADFGKQTEAAHQYASDIDRPGDHLVGVTGTAPLQAEQTTIVRNNVRWVEIGSVAVVALIVGVTFRSVLAPAVTLLTAAVTYLLTARVVGAGAELTGFSAPAQLEPVLVALSLGVATDYSIFFLAGMQRGLAHGDDRHTAARATTVEYLPIVLVAGATVAGGVLALVAAETTMFRAFGPGLAVTVLMALLISVTLVPALLAVLGRAVFWPLPPRPGGDGQDDDAGRMVRLLTRRWVAAFVAVAITALLVLAALPLRDLRESFSPMTSLPRDNPVRVAWQAAADGFGPGVLSPTEIILNRPGIASDAGPLSALQSEIGRQPGVARVLGPQDFTLPPQLRQEAGLFLAPDGGAARYLAVLDADPLGAEAVADLRRLEGRMPELLAASDLGGASVSYAGDTALGLSLVESTRPDVVRVAVVIALVDLLLLVLFLRAVVAPLYLLAASFLSLAAVLGLTTLFFEHATEEQGIVFFVPFAAGALLISLGSDYSIFSVGYVRAESRNRPMREALVVAIPRSRRAITAAGLALAASFGLVALVPLAQFRELAFALGVGVVLDVFVVRSWLVPALMTLEAGRKLEENAEKDH
ncbi:membrane protein [Saccharopolyspora erythraea D]|nr:membrane protein [Saccharopolyspora erythraea D]